MEGLEWPSIGPYNGWPSAILEHWPMAKGPLANAGLLAEGQ